MGYKRESESITCVIEYGEHGLAKGSFFNLMDPFGPSPPSCPAAHRSAPQNNYHCRPTVGRVRPIGGLIPSAAQRSTESAHSADSLLASRAARPQHHPPRVPASLIHINYWKISACRRSPRYPLPGPIGLSGASVWPGLSVVGVYSAKSVGSQRGAWVESDHHS
jgi:hypothetical protein